MLGRWSAFAALAALVACGGSGGFTLTSDDNDPQALRAAMAQQQTAAKLSPVNDRGAPMVYVVTGASKGKGASLIAYDLAAQKQLWRAEADVKSRVVAGRKFVAHVDGAGNVVAYDSGSGKRLWSAPTGGTFLGMAADAQRVFFVTRQRVDGKQTWFLVGLDGATGAELWRTPSPGQLGTPAARGGLVFSPFLKQWLVILDAGTGAQLARIRGIDEEIAFVRATSDEVYFGSKSGVFLLDERAASGKRDQSTYGSAALPNEFVRSFYHWDAFDPVQTGYSAYDRNRVLWRGKASGEALAFSDDRVVVHNYRFFFGFDAGTGGLAWAYNHPRADAVASQHLGEVIGFVSVYGELGALDPETGARLYDGELDLQGTVRGATFDADGWSPSGSGEANDTAKALVSIARDRDQRFLDVKLFALTALGKMKGGEVTADLLALITDDKTPPKVHDKAVQVLVARKDAAGLPILVEALQADYDYIAGTRPRAVGVIARAIAAMGELGKVEADAAVRGAVVAALSRHLFAPQTPAPALTDIARALGASGLPGSMAPLRRFLLTYRADPSFSSQVAAVGATIDALLERGGVQERELVAFVAEDPRTQPGIAEYASRALRQTDYKRDRAVPPTVEAGSADVAAAD